MAACVVEQLSSKMQITEYPRNLHRAITYDPSISMPTCPKRLLSEHYQHSNLMTKFDHDANGPNKRKKKESLVSDVNDDSHRIASFSSTSSVENNISCALSNNYPGHHDLTSLNDGSYSQSVNITQTSPPSSLTKTPVKTMLTCQADISSTDNNENSAIDRENSPNFITSAQLAAYMTSFATTENDHLLIIDCGVPMRYNERRLKNSFLLNINDKLSRKRLISRGLNNFLDQSQLNRLNQCEIIVLYDDLIHLSSSSCSNSTMKRDISPVIKCIMNELKRYDANKIIHILESSFDDFYQHYPTHCYTSVSHVECIDIASSSRTVDLESFVMSEVLPGLYLGNARDAQDMSLLKKTNIQSIVNISKSIPCYYEHEASIDYIRVSCNDSCQEEILPHFDSLFKYIHEKLLSNQAVLVHCQGGISRSPSFVIGYLMKYHSKTFDEAHGFVRNKRRIINPNLGFLSQLAQYEQMLMPSMQ